MPKNDITNTAQRPQTFGRNLYLSDADMREYAGDVAGASPYYMLERTGPMAYQFQGSPETDTEAYAANMSAMRANAVPEAAARYIWMRRTPDGMIYSTADKLFAGSDFSDSDLAKREERLRALGWSPAIE